MKVPAKRDFKKIISDYLWGEAVNAAMGMFVFIVLIVGLFYATIWEQQTILVDIFFYCLILLVGVVMIYVSIFEFYKLNIYKKILKNDTYVIENCVPRNVSMKMNRGRKEIELVAKYENTLGELSDREVTILSQNKKLCVSDCEGKDCKYIKLTDNYGFIFVE